MRCGLGQRTAQPPQKWTEKVGELVIIIFPGLHFLKGHSLIPPQHQQNPMANGSSPRTCFVCGRLKLPWESSKSHGLSIIHYVLGSKTTHPCASIITPPASLRVGAMLPASEGLWRMRWRHCTEQRPVGLNFGTQPGAPNGDLICGKLSLIHFLLFFC